MAGISNQNFSCYRVFLDLPYRDGLDQFDRASKATTIGDKAVHLICGALLWVPIFNVILALFFRCAFAAAPHQEIPLKEEPSPFYISREFRVISSDRVEEKLEREFQDAQLQMNLEKDVKRFSYEPLQMEIPHEEEASLKAGAAFLQGRRPTMEDDHLMIGFQYEGQSAKLFGVFDGHGGAKVSVFVRKNLQNYLTKNLDRFGMTDEGIFNAFKMAFVELDQDYQAADGTTATVAFIFGGKIWVANVGDSRTVLNDEGIPVQLSEDAKPGMEKYRKGIQKRGGFVTFFPFIDTPRVNGRLAVARSIGDHSIVGAEQHRCTSPRPKIIQVPEKGSHLILACDGLWDVASTRQVVEAVENDGSPPCAIAQKLVQAAYLSGSRDNISAMVIEL